MVDSVRDLLGNAAPVERREPRQVVTRLLLVVLAVLAVWSLGVAIGFLWPLRILAVGAGLAALQIRWRPQLALIGVAALCALDPLVRVYLSGELLRWNSFNYWLLLVALASVPFQLRALTSHTALLAGVALLLVVGLLYTPDLSGGVQDTIQSVAAFFALRLYVARALDAERDALYRAGVVTAWLVAGGGLVYMLERSSLPDINSNSLGAFLVTGPVAAALALGASRAPAEIGRPPAYVVWIPAAVCFAWLVLSGSRGSMAVGAVCLIFLFLTVARRRLAPALAAAAAVALIVVGLLSLFPEQREATLDKFDDLLTSDASIADRTDLRSSLALGGLDLARENPLGVGTGAFRDTLADSPDTVGRPWEAHSGWAKLLAENGFGALILAVAFVVSYPVEAARRPGSGLLAISVMAAVAMGLAFMTSEFQAKWIWLLAAGLAEVQRRVPVGSSGARAGTPARPRR